MLLNHILYYTVYTGRPDDGVSRRPNPREFQSSTFFLRSGPRVKWKRHLLYVRARDRGREGGDGNHSLFAPTPPHSKRPRTRILCARVGTMYTQNTRTSYTVLAESVSKTGYDERHLGRVSGRPPYVFKPWKSPRRVPYGLGVQFSQLMVLRTSRFDNALLVLKKKTVTNVSTSRPL